MDYEEYMQLKANKKHSEHLLDALAKKYNSDQLTIDCTKMTEQDYNLYITLDSEVQRIKEKLRKASTEGSLNLNSISKKLIEDVNNYLFAEYTINKLGNIGKEEILYYFLENHKNDLTWYRQEKQSGYNVIVLFKSVAIVCVLDFMLMKAMEIQKILPESKEWRHDAERQFFNEVLKHNFKGDYLDKRYKTLAYKPRAYCMCQQALREIRK